MLSAYLPELILCIEINVEIRNESYAEITAFAQEWVQANAMRLLNAADHVDVLGLISYDECRSEDLHLMTDQEIDVLKEELNRFRHILLQSCRAARPPIAPTGTSQPSPYIISAPQAPFYTQSSVPGRHNPAIRSEADHTIPRAPQTYHKFNNFMENQRSLHPRGETSARGNRNRGWSNDTNRGGRGPGSNNAGQYNTPRNSPPRYEPVYVLTGHHGASSDTASMSRQNVSGRPRTFSGTRNFSNDARNSPFSRRTVSDHTFSRPFSNHSRIPSSSSAGVAISYLLSGANQNSNEGHEPTVDTQNPNSGLSQALDIHHYPYNILPSNRSVTIFYTGEPRKLTEQPLQTVYVSGVPVPLFVNHTFREMMSECGEVDTISHLLNRNGSAFVLFHDEMSVQKAIDRFHGYPMGDGSTLKVSVPDKSRGRGFSMSSFDCDRGNGYGRTHFRDPSGHYNNRHARTISSNVHREPFRPPIPEIPENQSGQSLWKPLRDVSNMSPNNTSALQNAAGRAFFQPSTAASSPKKENSPIATPSRSVMQSPKSESKSKKSFHQNRKTSQQNSKQPTPVGSPKRPLLERKSTSSNIKSSETEEQNALQRSDQALLHEHVSQRLMSTPLSLGQDTVRDILLSNAVVQQLGPGAADLPPNDESAAGCTFPAESAPKAKAKNKSKKKNDLKKGDSSNIKNLNASFIIDSSSDTVSPIDNNSGSVNGFASTNTSFSMPSSRQPSANTTSRKTRELGRKVDEASNTTSQVNEPTEKKKSASEGLGSVSKIKNSNRKPSKNRNTSKDSIPVLATGHQKNSSTSSVVSVSSQRKADVMVRKTEQQTSTSVVSSDANRATPQQEDAMSPSAAVKVKDNVADPRSISIVIPSRVVHIANLAENQVASSVVSPSNMPHSAKSLPEPLVSTRLLSETEQFPKQLNEQDWPALTCSKSPVATIADGKPPNPIRAPLMKMLTKEVNENSLEIKKIPKSSFPPVAVPRYFKSSRSTA